MIFRGKSEKFLVLACGDPIPKSSFQASRRFSRTPIEAEHMCRAVDGAPTEARACSIFAHPAFVNYDWRDCLGDQAVQLVVAKNATCPIVEVGFVGRLYDLPGACTTRCMTRFPGLSRRLRTLESPCIGLAKCID